MNKPSYMRYLSPISSDDYLKFIEDNDIQLTTNNNYNREKYFGESKNFFLVEHFNINDPELLKTFFEISEKLNSILNSEYGDGSIYNLQFSLLPPKSKIKKHYDDGLIFTLANRIHLPITTNNEVLFFIGDQKFNLKTNQLVEINNKKMHSVINNSDQSRIHLIMDYLPLKYAKYLN